MKLLYEMYIMQVEGTGDTPLLLLLQHIWTRVLFFVINQSLLVLHICRVSCYLNLFILNRKVFLTSVCTLVYLPPCPVQPHVKKLDLSWNCCLLLRFVYAQLFDSGIPRACPRSLCPFLTPDLTERERKKEKMSPDKFKSILNIKYFYWSNFCLHAVHNSAWSSHERRYSTSVSCEYLNINRVLLELINISHERHSVQCCYS